MAELGGEDGPSSRVRNEKVYRVTQLWLYSPLIESVKRHLKKVHIRGQLVV